nr:unnamed protein product [Callosobruchus chinensis]
MRFSMFILRINNKLLRSTAYTHHQLILYPVCLRDSLYADDKQITSYFFPNLVNIATQEINKDLENIYISSTEHNFKLNPDKCTVVLFTKYNIATQLKSELKLKINGTALNYGSRSKDLGLLVE